MPSPRRGPAAAAASSSVASEAVTFDDGDAGAGSVAVVDAVSDLVSAVSVAVVSAPVPPVSVAAAVASPSEVAAEVAADDLVSDPFVDSLGGGRVALRDVANVLRCIDRLLKDDDGGDAALDVRLALDVDVLERRGRATK